MRLRRLANHMKADGCSICGSYAYPEFHHTRDKVDSIASMMHRGVPIEVFEEELDKCIVLCHRCHEQLHSGVHA
jgi:hypothetical protein